MYYNNPVVKTVLYPGIPEMLSELETKSVPKGILSNKTHGLVLEVVEILLSGYTFSSVWGHKKEYPRKPDPTSALEVAGELKYEPQQILYCGDSGVDMETARNAGMYAVGVLWGFRDKDELMDHGADTVVAAPDELISLMEGGT